MKDKWIVLATLRKQNTSTGNIGDATPTTTTQSREIFLESSFDKMMFVLLVGILIVFLLLWDQSREGVIWPEEIPDHRPALGDFLVTEDTPGVNQSGYEELAALGEDVYRETI